MYTCNQFNNYTCCLTSAVFIRFVIIRDHRPRKVLFSFNVIFLFWIWIITVGYFHKMKNYIYGVFQGVEKRIKINMEVKMVITLEETSRLKSINCLSTHYVRGTKVKETCIRWDNSSVYLTSQRRLRVRERGNWRGTEQQWWCREICLFWRLLRNNKYVQTQPQDPGCVLCGKNLCCLRLKNIS